MRDATARFFDAMAPSYDELEPWYQHLYARLHGVLRAALAPAPHGARALDAGCGTGFQTAILAELGYRTHGVDLSAGSLGVARERQPAAAFVLGDLAALPYADAVFDAAVCMGSTLDFVEDAGRAIRELARVLRPDAPLLIEYERRWSLDLWWTLVSSLTGDPLGYGLRPRAAWALLSRPFDRGVWLDYPGYPLLRLFTDREIDVLLAGSGFRIEGAWGVHALTTLLPSTVLHRPRLSRPLDWLYEALARGDTALTRWPPTRAVSAHALVLARRAELSQGA
jgi:SAM-dependent methyltransferase